MKLTYNLGKIKKIKITDRNHVILQNGNILKITENNYWLLGNLLIEAEYNGPRGSDVFNSYDFDIGRCIQLSGQRFLPYTQGSFSAVIKEYIIDESVNQNYMVPKKYVSITDIPIGDNIDEHIYCLLTDNNLKPILRLLKDFGYIRNLESEKYYHSGNIVIIGKQNKIINHINSIKNVSDYGKRNLVEYVICDI